MSIPLGVLDAWGEWKQYSVLGLFIVTRPDVQDIQDDPSPEFQRPSMRQTSLSKHISKSYRPGSHNPYGSTLVEMTEGNVRAAENPLFALKKIDVDGIFLVFFIFTFVASKGGGQNDSEPI